MTPFGLRLRELRDERGLSLRRMAAELEVSPAYISALEHGHRSAPSWAMVQRIITLFNLIWDDADELQELARLSHPRVVIDTAGLTPEATEMANLLSKRIHRLSPQTLQQVTDLIMSGESADRGEADE